MYEAGWLTFLVKSRLTTEQHAREAMKRAAVAIAAELNHRKSSSLPTNRKGQK
jgi:hypothetical protein